MVKYLHLDEFIIDDSLWPGHHIMMTSPCRTPNEDIVYDIN